MSAQPKWEIKQLSTIADRIDYGHTASANAEPVGPKLLRITDIQSGRVEWNDVPYCLATTEDILKYELMDGDIVFARTGNTTGKSFLLKSPPPNTVFASYLIRVRPGNSVEPRFLAHFFNTPNYWAQIEKNTEGAGQPGVNASRLKTLEIPLPPLSEQKRIADILDKADAIRRKRQVESETLAALCNSLFLRLFGDLRNRRNEWPQTCLKEVTLLDAPMVDPREDEYIDLVHLGPDRIEKTTGRILPALTAREEGLISSKFLFDERHVLYSKIRPYLRKVALPNFSGLCSADVYPIRPAENKVTREFLFALLISEAFLAYTTSLPSRASIPKLNRTELAAFTFSLPPLELQQRFTAILQSQEKMKKTLHKASYETESLFNTLVQRAFIGEL